MEDKILYVILNGELGMSPGKAAAQAVHAVMKLDESYREYFVSSYRRTVVILEAKNEMQLDNLWDYLNSAGIKSEYYTDEGVNEVDAFSMTALAVEPFSIDDTKKREIFSKLPLFPSKKEVKEEPNFYRNAWVALSDVINHGDGILGVPWYVRKTIKWLRKQK